MCQVSVRVDDIVKKNAEAVCKEIGISLSAAINIYLRRIGWERKIPFELSAEIPNAETLTAMAEVEKGENLVGPFNSVKELMESLNADD